MKLEESDKLEKNIQFLSSMLLIGFNKCQGYKNRAHNKDLINAKFNTFMKELNTEFHNWADDTLKYLQTELKDKYYFQYHFVAHKGTSMTYINMNEQASNTIMSWEGYFRNLEDIIFRLEDARNLQVRREIAEIENQADIVYEIKYNSHMREIKLNNITITKPDFESENCKFFDYVFANPNKPLTIEEIKELGFGKGSKLKKQITDIVRDLGFNGKLRQIFFPVVQKNQVMFINPITKQYFIKNDLPALNMNDFRDTKRKKEV
jgi:hypothetical protein